MFCRPQSGNTLESKGGVETGKTILLGRGWIPQSETRPLRNEAPLNCVALRSSLDYEVAWRAVKGQDERQITAPLTALHATWELAATSGKKYGGRHVGLDFYDLLIEALSDEGFWRIKDASLR